MISDHLGVSRGHGRAPLLSVIAVVVGVAGLVWFLSTRPDGMLGRLNSIAGVISLAVGIISLVVAVAGVVVATRSGRPVGAPDEARDRLRRAVRRQWDREIGIRKLRTPRPLRLTWAPSPRGNVSARVVGARAPSGGLALRAGARPTAELMREFRNLPSRRLVVLGQAGAGKSVLAMLITVDLLTEAGQDSTSLKTTAHRRPSQGTEDPLRRTPGTPADHSVSDSRPHQY